MALRRATPLVDQLPELYPYKDDGCELSPSCLYCSLRMCKYDDPGWIQRERRRKRDGAVLEARRQDRLTVPQLARRFRISERTVFRILAELRPEGVRLRLTRRPQPEGHARSAEPFGSEPQDELLTTKPARALRACGAQSETGRESGPKTSDRLLSCQCR